jgi:hypothetical protein
MASGQLLFQLVQGLVVLLLEQSAHLLHTLGVELRLGPPTVRTRGDTAGLTLQSEIVLHCVGRDDEPLRQFPHAPLAVAVGVGDPLP